MAIERSPRRTDGNDGRDRLVVGWFSFTCCEDSTLKTRNSLAGLDVAFVEGAISSDSQAEEARRIRENARFVVAIGACACTGKPSTSRNQFVSEQINERIRWYLSHFDYGPEVRKLDDVIEVDDMVRGCPMKVPAFLQTLSKYLDLFNVSQHA
jgi:coenzyme F420-reducing hydrogenase gamma subunit